MTTAFFAPPDAFRGRRVVLPDDEAQHASKVLRTGPGDEIVVVDGAGGWHTVRLDHVSTSQVVGTVVETRRDVGEPAVHVTVGVGLVKSRNRFETFVEKAVELGVRRIVPLHTARTEKTSIRPDRTRNVMVAAMKQCGRSRLPSLASPTAFDALLDDWTGAFSPEEEDASDDATLAVICHEAIDGGASLAKTVRASAGVKRVLVLVGPEGGFTSDEIDAATNAGVRPVSLGARRLRAETAAILAPGLVLAWADGVPPRDSAA